MALVASKNMSSSSADTGNWAFECAGERCIKQTMPSKDYDLVLNNYNNQADMY